MPRNLARAQIADALESNDARPFTARPTCEVIALRGEEGARRIDAAWLASLSASDPYRSDPATYLAGFSLTTAQRTQLAGLNALCRAYEIGPLIYAHLYQETCRARHVAILSHDGDLGLQRYWQANRQALVKEVLDAFFSEPRQAGESLDDLAARAIDAADELRLASDDAWDAANEAAYEVRHAFRQRFFAATGLEPQRLGQLQMEGVL